MHAASARVQRKTHGHHGSAQGGTLFNANGLPASKLRHCHWPPTSTILDTIQAYTWQAQCDTWLSVAHGMSHSSATQMLTTG